MTDRFNYSLFRGFTFLLLEYVDSLCQRHSLQITLGSNLSIGYYIQMNVPGSMSINMLKLPKDFIILKKKGNILFLTTEQLVVDSQKSKEMCEEIHIMSNV